MRGPGVGQHTARLRYRINDTCNNTILGAGDGAVPLSWLTGSISQAFMRVSGNVTGLAGYSYTGIAFNGTVRWDLAERFYDRRTVVNYEEDNGVRTRETRDVTASESADVASSGAILLGPTGTFNLTLSTVIFP